MNCGCCNQDFNLLDCIPYTFHSCGESFCFECIKNASVNEIVKCPKCLKESNYNIKEIQPNLKMIQILEKLIILEKKKKKKQKVICENHNLKIIFQ